LLESQTKRWLREGEDKGRVFCFFLGGSGRPFFVVFLQLDLLAGCQHQKFWYLGVRLSSLVLWLEGIHSAHTFLIQLSNYPSIYPFRDWEFGNRVQDYSFFFSSINHIPTHRAKMRPSPVILLAVPLVALAMQLDPSNDAPATDDKCALGHCEQVDTPPVHEPHIVNKTGVENITSIVDVDGPIEAKGGRFGGLLLLGSHSSAAPRSVSNPLSVLRGPILWLDSVFSAVRARVSWGESSDQPAGSEFVGKTL
jgi:hypothetical protein